MMKVKDFMIKDVIAVHKDDTLKDLLQKLVSNKIGGVPVIDPAGKIISMVSDGDALRYLNPREETIYDFYYTVFVREKEEVADVVKQRIGDPVENIMTKRPIVSVHPEDDFRTLIGLISKHRYKKIPVVDDDRRVVGVISRGDAIRYIVNQLI